MQIKCCIFQNGDFQSVVSLSVLHLDSARAAGSAPAARVLVGMVLVLFTLTPNNGQYRFNFKLADCGTRGSDMIATIGKIEICFSFMTWWWYHLPFSPSSSPYHETYTHTHSACQTNKSKWLDVLLFCRRYLRLTVSHSHQASQSTRDKTNQIAAQVAYHCYTSRLLCRSTEAWGKVCWYLAALRLAGD